MMLLNVRHNLQLYDPAELETREEDALVLPMADAKAVMGETVTAFLARVGWRFQLPTVCKINGEYYLRSEWPEKALAANDEMMFVSRPLGNSSGGSAVKSITAVVALVALSALAPGIGTAAAGSLLFGGGAAAGALASVISAAIVGAAAQPLCGWMAPSIPVWRQRVRAAWTSLRGILDVANRFIGVSR